MTSDIPGYVFYGRWDLTYFSYPNQNLARPDRDSPVSAVKSGIRTAELWLVGISSYPKANLVCSLMQAAGQQRETLGFGVILWISLTGCNHVLQFVF